MGKYAPFIFFLKMLKKLTNIHLYTFISMCEDKVPCKTDIFRGQCEKEKNFAKMIIVASIFAFLHTLHEM
jgi:hypothetical protein